MQLHTKIFPLHPQEQLTVAQIQTPSGVPGILVWRPDRHQHTNHKNPLKKHKSGLERWLSG